MKKLKASEITEPGPNHADIMDALRSVYNYFWNPDVQTPILSEGDVHDLVERALKAEPPKVCRWKSSEGYDGDPYYETECDNSFVFIEGDLKDNEFEYCSYCGGHIEIEESEG